MLSRALALLLAAGTALILFLHYFLPAPAVQRLAQPLLGWIVQLSAAALLLAMLHLLHRHAARLRQAPLDALVILAFLLTFAAGLLPADFLSGSGRWLYQWLLGPGLAALFALLPIFLAYALLRHLRLRSVPAGLFALGFLIVLAGQTPALTAIAPWSAALRHNLLIGPGAAALRGVLIALALAALFSALQRWRRVA